MEQHANPHAVGVCRDVGEVTGSATTEVVRWDITGPGVIVAVLAVPKAVTKTPGSVMPAVVLQISSMAINASLSVTRASLVVLSTGRVLADVRQGTTVSRAISCVVPGLSIVRNVPRQIPGCTVPVARTAGSPMVPIVSLVPSRVLHVSLTAPSDV
jgi:hypothetical protein